MIARRVGCCLLNHRVVKRCRIYAVQTTQIWSTYGTYDFCAKDRTKGLGYTYLIFGYPDSKGHGFRTHALHTLPYLESSVFWRDRDTTAGLVAVSIGSQQRDEAQVLHIPPNAMGIGDLAHKPVGLR